MLIIIFVIVRFGEFKYAQVSNLVEKMQDKDISIIATVVSRKEEKEYMNKYIIKIKQWNFKYDNLKFILYTDKDINLNYGDNVRINGNLENAHRSRNYKGFDYNRYLRHDKIYGICNLNKIEIISRNNNIFTYIFKIRDICFQKLDENFDDKEASFLKGILLGDTSFIEESEKENFQKSSLAHMLAISGMHVAYIIIAIDFLLDKIIFSRKLKNYIEILFLIFFIIFTGGTVSCIRAGIMMILFIISKNIYRLNDFYSSLFFSFCFVLIYNPYNIEAVGMWLSFFGTLGLVVFKRKIECSNKVLTFILNSIYTSFSVQILIFPIILYCYNTFSLTFFISNLLVSFFIGPVLILGYSCIFLYKLTVLVIVENILINIIMKIALFVSSFKLFNFLIGTPSLVIVIFYYILIIFLLNRNKIIKQIVSWNFKFKILLILIVVIMFFMMNSFIKKDNIQLHFLDVGQGDCSFVILPNGKNILIDGGDRVEEFDYGERVVGPYLLDKNIMQIDYMIISHFDSDHVGGLLYIAENFDVKNILIGVQFEENDNLNQMIEIIKEKNINLIILEKGNKIKLDKEVYLEVLFPIRYQAIMNNSINNNSLVFKLIFQNITILFTGDIEEEAENKLVELYKEKLKCDILKVAHHGSITSSTEEFIKYAKPKIALIGCGENNKFGHPNIDILKRLNELYTKVFRTDEDGEINIVINSYSLKIDTHINKNNGILFK